MRPTPDGVVWARALAVDIVLCSWARHFTLTVPLSTQVYKWVPAICWGKLTNCGGVACDGLASRPGEVEIPLTASCYRNQDRLRQLSVSHGSKASHLILILQLVLRSKVNLWLFKVKRLIQTLTAQQLLHLTRPRSLPTWLCFHFIPSTL